MSRIYARACLSGRRAGPCSVRLGSRYRLSGITGGSGLRTYTPSKRRASVATSRGGCLVSSCVDGSCLIPTTTTASTIKTSPMTATARINMADISVQLPFLIGRSVNRAVRYTPVACPPVSTAHEGGGCVGRPSVAADCGPATPVRNPQAVSPAAPLSAVMQGLSSVFAQRLRRLMHRLLSWQPKTAQTNTSQYEPMDKTCDIAFHTLPQGGQEVTRTSSAR